MQRILIVEPDHSLRVELARSVRSSGWFVDEAADFTEAFLRLHQTALDAALVDLNGSGSINAVSRLRRNAPHMVVVAMSARPSLELAVEAMKHGARDFLRKPFSVEALEGTLSSVLASRPRSVGFSEKLNSRDPAMEILLREARVAAASDATVQIVGENGTGKDLLARFIHDHSARRGGPLVAVNCAALPEGLAESELFGHERGAFTGAVECRTGQIAAAHGGTLLLDEVSELTPKLQPKLLRVLQEREILSVGSLSARPIDVRVLATTQRDLGKEVAAGRFREDLYYRLDVVVLRIPPLRERPADIPYLANLFLERGARNDGVDPPRLTGGAAARLGEHGFPGNVRELENLMRRAVVLFPGREVDVERLFLPKAAPSTASVPSHGGFNLREIERRTIIRSLSEFDGNRTLAAHALGISVRTLRNKIHLYQLT